MRLRNRTPVPSVIYPVNTGSGSFDLDIKDKQSSSVLVSPSGSVTGVVESDALCLETNTIAIGRTVEEEEEETESFDTARDVDAATEEIILQDTTSIAEHIDVGTNGAVDSTPSITTTVSIVNEIVDEEDTTSYNSVSDVEDDTVTEDVQVKANIDNHASVLQQKTTLPVIEVAHNKENNSNNYNFNVGDRVRVVKKGHKKYGRSGIIVKQTKCYVFFEEDSKKETIKIYPSSLALESGASTGSDELSSIESKESSSLPSLRPNHISSTTTISRSRRSVTHSNATSESSPLEKPTDFALKSSVTVVDTHTLYAGKVGTVTRHTAKFVVLVFKESPNKECRISPKFLIRNNSSIDTADSISTMNTANSEVNSNRVTRSQSNNNAIHNSGSLAVPTTSSPFGFGRTLEKICFGDSNKLLNESAFVKIFPKHLKVEMPLTKNQGDLPQTMIHDNQELQLYYAEVSKDNSSGATYNKQQKVIAYYVSVDNLREHEEMMGDFATLPPNKVWARRKHFLSPAIKLKATKQYGVLSITSNDVTMQPDMGTVGCGFICEEYLEDLLGNNLDSKRALGIQIRIFIPTVGVFKGMLLRKRNVVGAPIQLNESLRKVGPSTMEGASDTGYIVIKNIFPSTDNLKVGRVFHDSHSIRTNRLLKPLSELKTFKESLRKERSCRLSPMHLRLLMGLGVSNETIDKYKKEYKKDPEKLCHTHLIGMADPTGKLPPNTVFLTGTNNDLEELFVTRSPCMEAKDGRVLKVVKAKPDSMEVEEWDWLSNLTFGAIIFGNPRPGDRALPELISDGDLDGDLFFVLWNRNILNQINDVPITDEELLADNESVKEESCCNPEWFSITQQFISKVPAFHSGVDQLVVSCFVSILKYMNMVLYVA